MHFTPLTVRVDYEADSGAGWLMLNLVLTPVLPGLNCLESGRCSGHYIRAPRSAPTGLGRLVTGH